jgi:UDP-N-acetyl-D-mannosaminuronic acid dehydrogenase
VDGGAAGGEPLVDADGVPAKDVRVEDLQVLDLDAAVVATAHDEFDAVDWRAFAPMVVVDGRDAVDLDDTDHRHYVVGRGWQ